MVIEARETTQVGRITSINVPRKTSQTTVTVETSSSTPWANASPVRFPSATDARDSEPASDPQRR